MIKKKAPSEGPERLGDILKRVLGGRTFMLDCGHHRSLYPDSYKDTAIYRGWKFKVVCTCRGDH